MNFLSEEKKTCYIVGRPDIPQGYETVVEYELDRLMARGVLNFVFTGMGPFERLCMETLQRLQSCSISSRQTSAVPSATFGMVEIWGLL